MPKHTHDTTFITTAFELKPDTNSPRLVLDFSADANDGDYMYRTTVININDYSKEQLTKLAYLLSNTEADLCSDDTSRTLSELEDTFDISIPYSIDGDYHSLNLDSITFIDQNGQFYS